MATRKKTAHFEQSLGALESLVKELESGDLPLDQALKTFEKGINLTRECQRALSDAEQKVALLTTEAGSLKETPFTGEAEQ